MTGHDRHSLHSTLRENIVEHLFIGDLLRALWRRYIFDAEVLRSEFDAGGYDLVLTWRAVTRHIQLKVSRLGGKTTEVKLGLRLAEKPSGCAVWIIVDEELNMAGFLWFGGGIGEPLPPIGEMAVARHTKGDSKGVKAERQAHRIVKKSRFLAVDGMDGLLCLLLGDDFMEAGTVNPLKFAAP